MSGRLTVGIAVPCVLATLTAVGVITGSALAAGPATVSHHLGKVGVRPAASAASSETGNASVTVPVVLFGRSDGLPHRLSAGTAYDARIQVWVAGGQPDGSVSVAGQPAGQARSGAVTVERRQVTGGDQVRVMVRVKGKNYVRSYRHRVTRDAATPRTT